MGILIKAPTRHRDAAVIPVEANDSAAEATGALHIREVVRITGLRREQLYMWQRRYGFPAPLRDAFGDRVYPPDQVARLKLIKQLLSEGWRAGAVVPLADSALQSMLGLTASEPAPLPPEIETAVNLLAQHRVGELRQSPLQAARRAGPAQVPRADPHPAQRGRARARGPRRDAELPGAALRRSRAAAAARRDAPGPAHARRAPDPARHAAQRSQPARPRDPRAAPLHRGHQLPDPRRGRARAGDRRRREGLQGALGRAAVRSRHLGQDRGPGDPRPAHLACRPTCR